MKICQYMKELLQNIIILINSKFRTELEEKWGNNYLLLQS